MKKALKKLIDLTNQELTDYEVDLKPLNPNWREYNNKIVDYSIKNCAVTNRLVPAYVTSEAHGIHVWDQAKDFIEKHNIKSIVDLGCAAGEFLHTIKDLVPDLYGLTIHVGEVRYARENYGLDKVVPADMRDVNKYFRPGSIDMVFAQMSFDYLVDKERISLMEKIYRVLKPNKYFVHISDRRYPQSELPKWDYKKYFTPYKIKNCQTAVGLMTVWVKNV